MLAVVSLTPAELPFTAAIKSSVSLRDFLDGSLRRQIYNLKDICAFFLYYLNDMLDIDLKRTCI